MPRNPARPPRPQDLARQADANRQHEQRQQNERRLTPLFRACTGRTGLCIAACLLVATAGYFLLETPSTSSPSTGTAPTPARTNPPNLPRAHIQERRSLQPAKIAKPPTSMKATSKSAPASTAQAQTFKNYLRKIISFSPAAQEIYREKGFDQAADIEKIVNSVVEIYSSDEEMKCRVEEVVNSPGFTIKVKTLEELSAAVDQSGGLSFSPRSNTISMRLTIFHLDAVSVSDLKKKAIYDTEKQLTSVLRHEFQHAFVSRENTLNNIKFTDTKNSSLTGLPCQPGEDHGIVDCTTIVEILENTAARVQYLLRLSETPEDQMSAAAQQLWKLYKEAARNYVPETKSISIVKSTVQQWLVSDGENTWKLTPEVAFLETSFSSGHTRYIDSFESHPSDPEILLGNSHSSPPNEPLRAPLLDFQLYLEASQKAYQNLDGSRQTVLFSAEFDCIVEQLFGHSELYEFFLGDELRKFHRDRGSAEYRACLSASHASTFSELEEDEYGASGSGLSQAERDAAAVDRQGARHP